MATIAVQAGHCFRTRGAVGAPGEQHFSDRVSQRAVDLLARHGHHAVRVLADGVDYQPWDAFFAVHYDGHGNPDVSGASVGYRDNAPSREMAQLWKRQYQRVGWTRSWRGDNYTRALSGYYGCRLAQRAGTPRAIICEFGFGTNPGDRQWMEAHIDECARSLVATVGAIFGHPRGDDKTDDLDDEADQEDDDMAKLEVWTGKDPQGDEGVFLVQRGPTGDGHAGTYLMLTPDQADEYKALGDDRPDIIVSDKTAHPSWFDRGGLKRVLRA